MVFAMSCQPNEGKKKVSEKSNDEKSSDFVIAFGSCNNQRMPNPFWQQLTAQKPDIWIWGGDVIYSDTEDMNVLKDNYDIQSKNTDYQNFIKYTKVMETWDDHDYGVNDGGTEYPKKKESQQLFLDFFKVPQSDIRRSREGLYYGEEFKKDSNSIKVIILDTRYFRTPLTKDKTGKKRYVPNKDKQGTMLGETQWNWLQQELFSSKADVNIIMSSIQFLSDKHGFETWGNMPHEVERLEKIIEASKAKNVIILSGDRHISEFSKKIIGKDSIPLLDFTSSGLTHSYTNYDGEENPYRVGEVIFQKSYGILRFDFKKRMLIMEMWGEANQKLQTMEVHF